MRFLYYWAFSLLLLLSLSCSREVTVKPEEPIPIEISVAANQGGASGYSIQYDLFFKNWGEFYFPFEDWHWWKAQGIAESSLNPKAVSYCGAQGIMQIMPQTGLGLGLKNPWNPEENIQSGIKYDSQVDRIFKDINQPERKKFMFAGYNAGPGNIKKARRIANSDEWSSVADNLSSVTGKHSEETIGYVKHIYKIKDVI